MRAWRMTSGGRFGRASSAAFNFAAAMSCGSATHALIQLANASYSACRVFSWISSAPAFSESLLLDAAHALEGGIGFSGEPAEV